MPDFKNPNFFGIYNKDNINEEKEYLKLFQNAKYCKAIGEASGYLRNPNSPELIFKKIPKAKIIIMLRNPIERAYSHYLGILRGGDEKMSFSEAFNKNMNPINEKSDFYQHYVKSSFYFQDVKKWISVFGTEQVKIIIFEEFVKDTRKIVKEILEFLEIKSDLPENVGKAYNEYAEPLGSLGTSIVENKTIKKFAKSIIPGAKAKGMLRTVLNKKGKKPEIGEEQRKILKKIFKKDIEELSILLKKEIAWI